MQLYGYARVSTADQDLTLQEEKVRAADCEIIRAEKRSGGERIGRSELQLTRWWSPASTAWPGRSRICGT